MTKITSIEIAKEKLFISEHAYERAKTRAGLKPASLRRLVPVAYINGVRSQDTKGILADYLQGIYLRHQNATKVVLYGDFVYVFFRLKLLTLYKPNDNKLIRLGIQVRKRLKQTKTEK